MRSRAAVAPLRVVVVGLLCLAALILVRVDAADDLARVPPPSHPRIAIPSNTGSDVLASQPVLQHDGQAIHFADALIRNDAQAAVPNAIFARVRRFWREYIASPLPSAAGTHPTIGTGINQLTSDLYTIVSSPAPIDYCEHKSVRATASYRRILEAARDCLADVDFLVVVLPSATP